MSCQGKLYNPHHFAASLPTDQPIMIVFGAMAAGSIDIKDHPYVIKKKIILHIYIKNVQISFFFYLKNITNNIKMQEMISCSEYPLSGSVAINRVIGAIENQWGIV